jgi:hypothetical protein
MTEKEISPNDFIPISEEKPKVVYETVNEENQIRTTRTETVKQNKNTKLIIKTKRTVWKKPEPETTPQLSTFEYLRSFPQYRETEQKIKCVLVSVLLGLAIFGSILALLHI